MHPPHSSESSALYPVPRAACRVLGGVERKTLYGEDLARIHVEGYGSHWERAAPAVLRFLKRAGIERGLLVDLGCGGGQWLEQLAELGYDVVGIDQSAAMIRAARARVPGARLIRGSFADVELPRCDAVTALGEPLSYLDGAPAVRRVIRKVYAALRPGGLFVLDLRVSPPGAVAPREHAKTGEGFALFARITEAPKSLRRDITTFRRTANGQYRRGHETHRLRLYPRAKYLAWLRQAGFTVRGFDGYGSYRLAPRHRAYVARKPKK